MGHGEVWLQRDHRLQLEGQVRGHDGGGAAAPEGARGGECEAQADRRRRSIKRVRGISSTEGSDDASQAAQRVGTQSGGDLGRTPCVSRPNAYDWQPSKSRLATISKTYFRNTMCQHTLSDG
jgi:hypothetical protein